MVVVVERRVSAGVRGHAGPRRRELVVEAIWLRLQVKLEIGLTITSIAAWPVTSSLEIRAELDTELFQGNPNLW